MIPAPNPSRARRFGQSGGSVWALQECLKVIAGLYGRPALPAVGPFQPSPGLTGVVELLTPQGTARTP